MIDKALYRKKKQSRRHSKQLNEPLVKDGALLETQQRLLFLEVMLLLDQ